MALVYRADRQIATRILAKLKADHGIAPDAQFNDGSYQQLRQEVLPSDLDFLHMAGIRPITTTAPSDEAGATLDPASIEHALQLLKRYGFVAIDAFFSAEEPHKLTTEVGYRDFPFLYYLGQYAEQEISTAVLALLKQNKLIDAGATCSSEAFEELRREVRASFEIPDTAMSPVMERLLYLLASVKRPRRILGIGIFCGNTLVWTAGASCNGGKVYEADTVYGVDIDTEAIGVARRNFGRLTNSDHVELVVEDGRATAERLAGPFDCLYLDADSRENGKGIYLELLEMLYPKVTKGGWVLAHDTTLPAFRPQLAGYLSFVRDREKFSESISFDVDLFGMELSVK